MFMSMECDYVPELQTPTGILFDLQVIYEYEYVQPRWNHTDRVKPKNSERYFAHHTSRMK
jgi:5-methylcytosine-specific restriction endonuclease McrBC regulatory subunit McrC